MELFLLLLTKLLYINIEIWHCIDPQRRGELFQLLGDPQRRSKLFQLLGDPQWRGELFQLLGDPQRRGELGVSSFIPFAFVLKQSLNNLNEHYTSMTRISNSIDIK